MNLINHIDKKDIDIFNYLNIISNKDLFGKNNLYKKLNVNLHPMLHNNSEKEIFLFFSQLKGFLTLKEFSVLFDNYKNYQYYYFLRDNDFFTKDEINTLHFYINKKSKSNFYFLTNMKKELLYFYIWATNDLIKLENETNDNVFIQKGKKDVLDVFLSDEIDDKKENLVLNPDNDFLTTNFYKFIDFIKKDNEGFSFLYSFLIMHYEKNIEGNKEEINNLFKYDILYFLLSKTKDKDIYNLFYKNYDSFYFLVFFFLRGDCISFGDEFLYPYFKYPHNIFQFHLIFFKKLLSNPNTFKMIKYCFEKHRIKNIICSNKRLKRATLEKDHDYYFYYLQSDFGKYLGMFTREAKKELSADEFNTFIYSFSTFYTVLDLFYFETEDVIDFLNVLDENHIKILKDNIVLFDDFYKLFKQEEILMFKNKYKFKYFSTFKWSKELYQKLILHNPIFKYFKIELTTEAVYEHYNFSLLFALINEKDNSFFMLKNELNLLIDFDLFDLKNKPPQTDFSLLKENIVQKEISVNLNSIDNIDVYLPLFNYFIQYDKKIRFINLNIDLFLSIKKHLSINDFKIKNLLFSCLDYAYFERIQNIDLNRLEKELDLLKRLKFNANGTLTSSSKKIILMKYSN